MERDEGFEPCNLAAGKDAFRWQNGREKVYVSITSKDEDCPRYPFATLTEGKAYGDRNVEVDCITSTGGGKEGDVLFGYVR